MHKKRPIRKSLKWCSNEENLNMSLLIENYLNVSLKLFTQLLAIVRIILTCVCEYKQFANYAILRNMKKNEIL